MASLIVNLLLWITPCLAVQSFCGKDSTLINCTKIPRVSCCLMQVGCYTDMGSSENDFPTKPQELAVKVVEDYAESPRLDMTWSDAGGASLRALRGFHIKIGENKCYILRFNGTFVMGNLNDETQNFFNFTSAVSYGKRQVEVTSLPVPRTSYRLKWHQVSQEVIVTRRIEISYGINTNNTQSCELTASVRHNYSDTCHKVYLMKCDSLCRLQIERRIEKVHAEETLTFTVQPARYLLKAKPQECSTTDMKQGGEKATEIFEIRGSQSSCYIFDPDATTTEESSASSAALDLTTSQHSGLQVAVKDNPDNPKRTKYYVPVLASLGGLLVVAVVVGIAVKRWGKLLVAINSVRDIEHGNSLQPEHGNSLQPETPLNPVDHLSNQQPKKALISAVHFTPGNIIVIWCPIAEGDWETTYQVFVYDGQTSSLICNADEDHNNTDVIHTHFLIKEDVPKIEVELLTVLPDRIEASDFSGIIHVQRPVEIHEKSVLLIYSYDCEYHVETVTQFARILKSSKCDVKFERWDTDPQVDRRRWYEDNIRSSEKVIIIHSEGTYHKYNAYVKKQPVKDSQHTSLGDTFSLALNLVLSMMEENTNFRDKLRHVHFSYTSTAHLSSALITRAATYCITKNLKELILSVHGLPPSSHYSDYVLPGIDHSAMERLQRAIDNMSQQMKSNQSLQSRQNNDSGIDSHSNTSGSTASTDNNITDSFDPQNFKRPFLNIRRNSADMYEEMMTPEVPTTLSPGVLPNQPCPLPPNLWHPPQELDSPEVYPPFPPREFHPPEMLDTESESDA